MLFKYVAECLNHYVVIFRPSKHVEIKTKISKIILRARFRSQTAFLYATLKYGK